jgi:hypothetical protein
LHRGFLGVFLLKTIAASKLPRGKMSQDKYGILKLSLKGYKKWVIIEKIKETAETAAGASDFNTYTIMTAPDTWIGTAFRLGMMQTKEKN